MQHPTPCRSGAFLASATLGLLLFSLPVLAQSGTDSSGSTNGGSSSQRTTDTNRDPGFNPGWLGLLGLVGLTGLRRPQSHEVISGQRVNH